MTCRQGYHIISTTGSTVSLADSQTITCIPKTDTWSHQTPAGDFRWDTCSARVNAVGYTLATNLTLTGGLCPNTALLDTALDMWLNEQGDTRYSCYQDNGCSLGSGSSCSESGDSTTILYSFSIKQTGKPETDLMTGFSTKFSEDAKANKILLPVISSSGKRATTTYTSSTAATVTTTDCPAGAQLVNNNCVSCGAGQYETGGVCTPCPLSNYSVSTGSTTCTACSTNLATLFTGSTSSDDCVYKCLVPNLENGVSSPASGWLTSKATTIAVTCDPGYDTGHNTTSQYTCSDTYSCLKQCQLPVPGLYPNQTYSDGLTPGMLISQGRNVTLSCRGVADVLTCGTGDITLPGCSPRVEVGGGENIKSSTPATLWCRVSALLHPVNIIWHAPGGEVVTLTTSHHSVMSGNWSSYSQSSTLQISGRGTGSDGEYKCTVTGDELSDAASVTLDVFDVLGTGASVVSGNAATLTCTVSGSSQQLPVSWSRGGDVTLPSDVIALPGKWSGGTQIATLVANGAQSNTTYTCSVLDGKGDRHRLNIDLKVTVEPEKGGTGRAVSISSLLLFSSILPLLAAPG